MNLLRQSELELTHRQNELYTAHQNEWVALLYQPKSEPIVLFGNTIEELLDNVCKAHPNDWESFGYRQLLGPAIGLYEGH